MVKLADGLTVGVVVCGIKAKEKIRVIGGRSSDKAKSDVSDFGFMSCVIQHLMPDLWDIVKLT